MAPEEFQGKMLAGMARLETKLDAANEKQDRHEERDDQRFAGVRRCLDELRTADATAQREALEEAQSELKALKERRAARLWAVAMVFIGAAGGAGVTAAVRAAFGG